jgi:hypothetical protein
MAINYSIFAHKYIFVLFPALPFQIIHCFSQLTIAMCVSNANFLNTTNLMSLITCQRFLRYFYDVFCQFQGSSAYASGNAPWRDGSPAWSPVVIIGRASVKTPQAFPVQQLEYFRIEFLPLA